MMYFINTEINAYILLTTGENSAIKAGEQDRSWNTLSGNDLQCARRGAEINVHRCDVFIHPLISLLKSAHDIKILINHGLLVSVFCISKIWHT